MAVDTRNERASVINLDMPFGKLLPNPDGTVVLADRQQVAGKFASGLADSPPVGIGDTPYYPTLRPRRRL